MDSNNWNSTWCSWLGNGLVMSLRPTHWRKWYWKMWIESNTFVWYLQRIWNGILVLLNSALKITEHTRLLERNLSSYPREVKEKTYKEVWRPVLEYASAGWIREENLQGELEKVKNRTTRFLIEITSTKMEVWPTL